MHNYSLIIATEREKCYRSSEEEMPNHLGWLKEASCAFMRAAD